MKKITLGLLALSILITGCSTENKAKNKPVSSKNNSSQTMDSKEDKGKDNKESEEDKKDLGNQSSKEVQHDFDAISDLAKRHFNLHYDNIDIDRAYGKGYNYLPPGIFAMPYYSEEVQKFKNNSYAAPLYDFVDYFNIYNKNTYNEEDVLRVFKDIMSHNNNVSYEELDESFSEKTESEINEITSNTNFVKYYKKDKVVVCQIEAGIGGTYIEKISPPEYWKIEGDKVTVPFINPTNKAINYSVVLKVNNKNYTGGKKRSKYYFYDMIYYKY